MERDGKAWLDAPEPRQSTNVFAIIGGAAVAPINNIGRTVATLSRDIGSIAESVKVLPALLETLTTIERRTAHLEREVSAMRASVDCIHGDIDTLTEHVDELETSLHPIGRIRKRFGRADVASVNGDGITIRQVGKSSPQEE